ncbi:alpha/beta hydrolase [Kiloniella laminariae]|uniref:Alpha/beta hydrolase n=1 Tax=Kiloniella laminariae TaxID=454162 RepID=A0ABT4LLG6_9PROT|nr:alpha/beta hydrolase [Kiloniella laminariae]MCZ4281960.1 alpha/beta hydrolase [Kiloniella laminariae]
MPDKERLVFLPGLLCNQRLWRPQINFLGEDYVCNVPDLTRQDSIPELALSVLQQIRGKFNLVGLSMGGYVALEIMRQAPERVKRLALIDTKARADSAEQQRRRRGLLALADKGRFKGVTPHLMPLLIHPDRMTDESLTGPIYQMAEEVGQEAFVRQQTAILKRESHLDVLGNIKCPTQIICGRQDLITPLDCAEEIQAGITGSELLVVESCGHLANLEAPDLVNKTLKNWLKLF